MLNDDHRALDKRPSKAQVADPLIYKKKPGLI